MVFIRINARIANPNGHINFISVLPGTGDATDRATELMRGLAAQVRPVMKKHGLEINQFNEYENNPVFAGRNWENGAVVELVLRRRNGQFYSKQWLINVLCHELAHNMHMNHSPAFWAYYNVLKREVEALQLKGYQGDGFWSAGHSLTGQAAGPSLTNEEDIPEYLCGGAQASLPKQTKSRKRKATNQAVASDKTGAQTLKRRKGGSKVSREAFLGDGKALNADLDEQTKSKLGSSFKKHARSQRARDERLAAIEARLKQTQKTIQTTGDDSGTESESDNEYEEPIESNDERKRLMSQMKSDELQSLRNDRNDQELHTTSKILPTKSPVTSNQGTGNIKPAVSEVVAVAGSSNRGLGQGVKSQQWACGVCTFLNHEALPCCEVCETKR